MKLIISDETNKLGKRTILFDDSVMTINDGYADYCVNRSFMYCYYIQARNTWTNLGEYNNKIEYSQLSEEELFQRSTIEDVGKIYEIQKLMKYYLMEKNK